MADERARSCPVPDSAMEAFREKLEEMIRGRDVMLWLVSSDGATMNEHFSIGVARGDKHRLIEHDGGYYLLAEGVMPDLLHPLYDAFEHFCRIHHHPPEHGKEEEEVELRYRRHPSHVHQQHQVAMHYPVTMGKFHPPVR